MTAQPSLELAGGVYLSQRTAIIGRGPGGESGSLVVLYSQERWSAATWQAAYPALAAGAVAVLAVVVVTTLLARRFVRPIRRLGDQTARIAQGDFTPVGVGKVDDELRDLAVSINRMTERLGQYEREVRRSEQLRTLGQLGAGMAHQLRNAATGGRMAIELHQRQCKAAGGEDLAVALRQLRLMESYLQRFLTLSRPKRQVHEIVLLAALVDDVCALVRPACLHAGIELTALKPAEPLCVQGDAEELRQLVVNLVLNAVDATSGHEQSPARIVVALEPIDAGSCALCVRDSGPGPSAEVSGAALRALRDRQARGHGPGPLRRPADRRGSWRLDPLAAGRGDDGVQSGVAGGGHLPGSRRSYDYKSPSDLSLVAEKGDDAESAQCPQWSGSTEETAMRTRSERTFWTGSRLISIPE